MDYKEIVRAAAERKLVDLYKFFLDIIDEIKQDQDEGIENFKEALGECSNLDDIERLLVFLGISCSKKKQLRKMVLDKANDLIRELKQ